MFMVGIQILSLRQISAYPSEARQGILPPNCDVRIFPQDRMERTIFVLVVSTVAICEEWIYRGFVQRMLQIWLGRFVVAAIAGSALFFAFAPLISGATWINNYICSWYFCFLPSASGLEACSLLLLRILQLT